MLSLRDYSLNRSEFTRKHSSRMRTARCVWMQTPSSPGCRPPSPGHVTCDVCWEANPPPLDAGYVACDVCWEANPLPPMLVM